MIRQAPGDVIGVVLRFPHEGCHVLIVHAVEHGRAVAPPLHHTPIPQETKLVRHGRLGNPHQNGEIPHGEGSSCQGGEEANARGIGQRFRRVDDPLQLLVGRHGRLSGRERLRIEGSQMRVMRHA